MDGGQGIYRFARVSSAFATSRNEGDLKAGEGGGGTAQKVALVMHT